MEGLFFIYPTFSKGYLTLVIRRRVSIDHLHCQLKSTTIYYGAYAVNTLKVEIETDKGREMSLRPFIS